MKALVALLAVTAGFSMAGCSNTAGPDMNGAEALRAGLSSSGKAAASVVEFQTLDRNSVGPWMSACAELFNSEADWNAAMTAMEDAGAFSVLPWPEAPASVDWKRESVVLVALGELGSGAAGVEVLEMHRQGNHAVLDVAVTPPGPFAYMTAPYHVVKFQKKGIRSIEVRIR